MYTHKKSPHKYSFPQLISCVLLKIYMKNISYRDLEELLMSWADIREELGLKAVPDHSTLCRAQNRVTNRQIQRLLEKVVGLIADEVGRAILFACDSTGFKEDVASFYYALRSKKRRRRWIKAVYLLETHTQLCVSQLITRGPSGDARELGRLEGKSALEPMVEVMDRGFDGAGNFRLGIPFRIIPPIRRGGSIKGWKRIIEYVLYLVAKWMGIYGKRWICETMNSVIKRKFGDSIRERKEGSKKRIVSLMAITYNIHVIVRAEGKIRFFITFLYLHKMNVCNEA
jgi:IS5 family transposase